MINSLKRFGVIFLVMVAVQAVRSDELDDAKLRLKIEAQRIEREFASERSAAFRLVREDGSRLREATEKLQALIALIRNDTSLERARRDLFLATLRVDLDRVRDIADVRRAAPPSRSIAIQPDRRLQGQGIDSSRMPNVSGLPRTANDTGKGRVDDLSALLDRRRGVVTDKTVARLDKSERFSRTIAGIEDSAIPESADTTFPKNWKELTEKRSSEVKMTDMERLIMKGLATPIEVEFRGDKFQDTLDYLRKLTGMPISADKRALEESNVSYETPINLKLRGNSRTVLKRMLGELNLAYVIKDETVLITSRERAANMTVTKSYYLGDLVGLVGLNLDPVASQLAMLERVNNLVALIQGKVDPQSWRANNPDAAGVITFHGPTMSLIVKQTAEWHFMNHGK